MKVKLNPAVEEFRGSLGEIVFRQVRGKTIAARKPSVTAPVERQLPQPIRVYSRLHSPVSWIGML